MNYRLVTLVSTMESEFYMTPRTPLRALLLSALAFATLTACGDGKKSNNGLNPQELLTQLSQSLQTCGVLGPGKLQNQVNALPATDPAQLACVKACIAKADCASLRETFCGESGALFACAGACLQPKCADGTVLAEGQVCNGTDDCAGGEDEQGCEAETFACLDGASTVPSYSRCDGYGDCQDGSDEQGCPTFDCGDESTVAERLRCDGNNDCEDGADEVGCPGFQCSSDSTRVIDLDEVCDGYQDCPEAEDEAGCAQFMCEEPR